MLQCLGAGQAALALLVRHLVNLMQLPHDTLLLIGRQPPEAGIAAQHLLLVLHGNSPVLIEPVAKVPRR